MSITLKTICVVFGLCGSIHRQIEIDPLDTMLHVNNIVSTKIEAAQHRADYEEDGEADEYVKNQQPFSYKPAADAAANRPTTMYSMLASRTEFHFSGLSYLCETQASLISPM